MTSALSQISVALKSRASMRLYIIAAVLVQFSAYCIGADAAIELFALPGEPQLDVGKYPSCQKDWITTVGADRNAKIQLIVSCVAQLEGYNQSYLKHFTSSVAGYSRQLTLLDAKYHRSGASATDVQAFSQIIQAHLDKFASIDAKGNFGDGYQSYYDYLNRYRADLSALTESYKSIVNSS